MCVPFGRKPQSRLGLLFRAAAARPTLDALAEVEAAFDLRDGAVLRYADPMAQQGRAMRLQVDRRLQAFVLAGDASAQGWMLERVQQGQPAAAYGQALLAARRQPPQAVMPRSRQVCACHDVAEDAIVARLRAGASDAGPGDPELLTLKAVKALRRATVALVDDWVHPGVLRYLRKRARIVHVGKRGGCISTSQAFIHRLMVTEASHGERVLRVKGGGPFVFGRGDEDCDALRQAGIEVEVVSGLKARIAGPAAIGVPVTDRRCTRGVVLVTGQCGSAERDPDWAALARCGLTLVIYMGMSRAAAIARALLCARLPACPPARLPACPPARPHAGVGGLPRALAPAASGGMHAGHTGRDPGQRRSGQPGRAGGRRCGAGFTDVAATRGGRSRSSGLASRR